MKKLRFFFVLGVLVLMMTGCKKDSGILTFNRFVINPPTFTPGDANAKSYVSFTSALSRILYQENDVVYVNGEPFTLTYNGDHWEAIGTSSVSGEVFYCLHANGTVTGTGDPSYNVSFTSNLPTTSGIVLAGSTTTNVMTFTPAVAVLVFKPENMADYTGVKVGFDGSKIPQTFAINASTGAFSTSSYIPKAASEYSNSSMLTMKKDPGNSYFYVAIPIEGVSVSTKLYVLYSKSDATTEQRITTGAVTLAKGHVYVMPSESMDDYPFDELGRSKSTFSIAAGKHVKFSAGNLQCNPNLYTNNLAKAWIIATHQYDQQSYTYNLGLTSTTNHYIDVFGWATSGYEQYDAVLDTLYTHYPYQMDADNTMYYAGSANADLSGSNVFDWGVYNCRGNRIYYGETQSSPSPASARWRTLTIDEWTYLLTGRTNATSLRGYATIYGIRGLVILPDTWSLPTGASFTANGPDNTYTLQQWAVMEKGGAIFLPACGMRTTSSNVDGWNEYGYYWSGTHRNNARCWALSFQNDGSTRSIDVAYSGPRYSGMSVRLVSPID